MKKAFFLVFVCAGVYTNAQVKTISQAVLTVKTTITSPEGQEDGPPSPPPGAEGGEPRTFRFGGDGETKSVISIKGDLIKTFIETEMNRTTIIRDNAKKITTTIVEMMGSKNGFYSTDADQEEMRKRMDSLLKANPRPNAGQNNNQAPVASEVVYTNDTKKIAGLQCKRAFVVSTRANGNKDSVGVWYCPDFKLQGLTSPAGIAGGGGGFNFSNRNTAINGLATITGFPMQYEMNLNRGRKMSIEVTKIALDKEIADKEFEIPKDVTLKSMKDMQSGDGRMQIRIGGPGGGMQ